MEMQKKKLNFVQKKKLGRTVEMCDMICLVLTFPWVTAPTKIGMIIPGKVATVFVIAINVPA